MRRRWPPLVALPFIARAVGLRILNPGATQPGLAPAVKVFRRGTATPVGITYATAPRLRDRMREGEVPDLLIAPVSMNDELVAAGRFTGERATLGRVGGSIIVRAGVPEPDKGDAAALRLAAEAAQALGGALHQLRGGAAAEVGCGCSRSAAPPHRLRSPHPDGGGGVGFRTGPRPRWSAVAARGLPRGCSASRRPRHHG